MLKGLRPRNIGSRVRPVEDRRLTTSAAFGRGLRSSSSFAVMIIPGPSDHSRAAVGRRRRRHAADRPFGGDGRAATHQRCRRHGRGGFPDEIAPRPEDYVFLKRRPSAFYGTGVAELLHMLRRDTIIIGGGTTNRGVETSVREAFNLDFAPSARLTGVV